MKISQSKKVEVVHEWLAQFAKKYFWYLLLQNCKSSYLINILFTRIPCNFLFCFTLNFEVWQLQILNFENVKKYCELIIVYKIAQLWNLCYTTARIKGVRHKNMQAQDCKLYIFCLFVNNYCVPLHTVADCRNCIETAVGNVTQWIPAIFAVKRFAVYFQLLIFHFLPHL